MARTGLTANDYESRGLEDAAALAEALKLVLIPDTVGLVH
jgi:hypothetical protein